MRRALFASACLLMLAPAGGTLAADETSGARSGPAQALEEFQAAMDVIARGDRKGAEARLEKAIFLAPNWALPRLEYGANCLETGCNPRKAYNNLKAAAAQDTENPRLRYYMAVALERLENPAAAEQEYARCVALRPSHKEARFALGRLLMKGGRNEQAKEHLEAAAELDPQNIPVHIMLAELYESIGELENAEVQLRTIMRRHPDNVYHRYRLAQFFERTGQRDKAREEFKTSEKLSPSEKKKKLRPLLPSKK